MRPMLLAVTLLSCRTTHEVAPPRVRPAPPPYDWKVDGNLRQDQGDARCVAELPTCKRAFGVYTLPPSPCAHKGTACTEVRSRYEGRWSCRCDGCAGDADCGAGEHCRSSGPPCAHERYATHCEKGERLPDPPCPIEMPVP